jgi:hypothetical protein
MRSIRLGMASSTHEPRPSHIDLPNAREESGLAQPELYFDDHQNELVVLDEIHRVPGFLLLVWPDSGIWAIEVKRSLSPTLGRGFHSGCADLLPTRKLVVYPGSEPLHVTADVDALPLATLAHELAA